MSISDNLTLDKTVKALDKVKAKFETENGRITIITPDRYAETYNIMGNHFVPDEPLCKAFGVTWDKEFEKSTHENLMQNLSICMISRDTNELLGVRVVGLMRSSDSSSELCCVTGSSSLLEFLNHKRKEVNFFERYGVNEAVRFATLGVHKKYRRKGIGGRLLGAAVVMSRELGFKAIKGEGTSNFSQRIYEKQGFETLVTMPYDSYFYKGQPIINATGEHKMTKVYGLKL